MGSRFLPCRCPLHSASRCADMVVTHKRSHSLWHWLWDQSWNNMSAALDKSPHTKIRRLKNNNVNTTFTYCLLILEVKLAIITNVYTIVSLKLHTPLRISIGHSWIMLLLHVCVCVCVSTCMCTCLHACVCVCVCVVCVRVMGFQYYFYGLNLWYKLTNRSH